MEIRLRSRKNPWVPVTIAVGLMLGAAAAVTFIHHSPKVLSLGFACVGLMFFVLARELGIHSNYLLTMDESGFLDSRLGIGKIDWSDVDHVNLELNYGHRALSFRLRRADLYLARLGARRRSQILARRKLGFQRFTVDLRGVDIDPIFLRGQISSMIQRHAQPEIPEVIAPLSYV